MEHAPLRPVPARPAGPLEPLAAERELAAWLPQLDPLAARALALVVLSERPWPEVAEVLGVAEDEVAALLAGARKELRQTIVTLPGSGWCERAEELISNRLDGPLADRDARRLDVHLRNCTRCVEHERRLVQATDALLAGIAPARPSGEPPIGDAPLAAVPPEDAAPDDVMPGPAAPTDPEDEALKEGVLAELVQPAAPTSEQIATAAEVLVTARTRRQLAAAITWNGMIAIAVILTVASIILIVAGALGAHF